MSTDILNLITILYAIITLLFIVVTIILTIKHIKKGYDDTLINLERNKNLIISGSILSELNKVESLINNKDLEDKYNYWKSIFKSIKDVDVPHITDELIEAEEDIKGKNFKEVNNTLATIEYEIYIAKAKSQELLDNIREITLSEERNREIVTKLKTDYRGVYLKYNNSNKNDYNLIQKTLELQFENVDKLFSAFEIAMDNNVYTEVGKIVKALDDTIGNLKIVIDEAPSIILMGQKMIPNKIEDIKRIADKMSDDGYNLDYLKIDYNINEAEKKVADIFDRLKVLNLEDSIFELRTILDYFDKLYADFEKEKISKKMFDDYIRSVILKCKKLTKIISGLEGKISDIKYSYDLTDDDVKIISELSKEVDDCENDYNVTMNNFRSKSCAYSKLSKDMERTSVRLVKAEEKLDYTLRSLGSLKEDEIRAKEQLDEIKNIMKQTKEHMYSFKLPVIPKSFYTEYSEAEDAIREMVIELDKKPISIKVLNTRVDTARDLVLKVYNTSLDLVKRASMAENAIVYGNRYRAINKEINYGLIRAEREFFKGNFNESLAEAIKSINVVEPGIRERLLEAYKNEYIVEDVK
ncbi:MAG TPA: septation ring formation regulator EzrA [Bacilli bacterium]|jgi:septation ring formation regulator|nr:septation ring formation regulator EzrA [Bacilli bacterium]HPZ23523.1 septation ring formation regulator EzrA [Bacilli bacterium]HQC83316.1 septation ring formation regulator EzrA [Bacilli bacterium]